MLDDCVFENIFEYVLISLNVLYDTKFTDRLTNGTEPWVLWI